MMDNTWNKMDVIVKDIHYKKTTLEMFKDYLVTKNLPHNFKTWKDYGNYLCKVLNNNKYTIYLIDVFDLKSCEEIEKYIIENCPIIKSYARNGDIIENIAISGNNSQGIYFIEKKKNYFKILSQNTEYLKEGSPNIHFIALENIPIDFYSDYDSKILELSQKEINYILRSTKRENVNKLYANDQSVFNWYLSIPLVKININKMGLHKVTLDDFIKNKYYYKFINYNNIKIIIFIENIQDLKIIQKYHLVYSINSYHPFNYNQLYEIKELAKQLGIIKEQCILVGIF